MNPQELKEEEGRFLCLELSTLETGKKKREKKWLISQRLPKTLDAKWGEIASSSLSQNPGKTQESEH